jgi:hypothetical protein
VPFREGLFYKVVDHSGYPRYNEDCYLELVGYTLYKTTPPEYDNRVCTPDVLHASKRLTAACRLSWVHSHRRVFIVRGTPVSRDERGYKHGFREYDVLRELSGAAIERQVRKEMADGYRYAYSFRRQSYSDRQVRLELMRFLKLEKKYAPLTSKSRYIA